jgi:hypothetical protein
MWATRFFPLILFRLILIFGTIIMTLANTADPGAAQAAWFVHAHTGMEVGPTGAQFGHSDPADARYCAHFDGREIVQRCLAAHADYLVLWARDGDYAYYDSRLLPKAPGLGERDPLREAVAEAHRHHLPLLAYCVVQQGGHYLSAHPEFEMRGVDGKPLGRFCYNSGYLEAMKRIVAEQLAYGIDGFHIDMLDQGFGAPYGCWCDSCRRKFAAEFGHPMPQGARWEPVWDEVLEFRYRTSAEFERQLRDYIKSVNPKATVDFNYHGNPPFSWEVGQRPVQHAGNADFVTGETGQWAFSALGVSLNAEFYRAATPGQPFQVAMQRGVRMYHDQTTRPLADIRWELLTLLAHDAFVTMVDKTGFEGRLDPVAYARIGAAFQDAHARQAEFGQRPVYDVGIYFSARTRDWVGRENPSAYYQSFQGAHKACVYEHLMCGVLLDESLSAERLAQFPVVCLPDVTILSDHEIALFRHYVEGGGRLLITGQSGQDDRYGRPLPTPALTELIGARVKGRLESQDNWVRLDTASTTSYSALHAAIPADWLFLVQGPATVYESVTAKPVGELWKPYRTTRQKEGKETADWPMSAEVAVGPAMLIHLLGKGTVLTLACSPDFATASDHHIVEARRLFANAIRWLRPAPRLDITAPANVETLVTDDPATRTLRVHLLAYTALPQPTPATGRPYVLPGLMEDAPLFRATVHAHFPLKGVRAFNHSTQVTHTGDTITATINDVHDVLLLHY